jgi:hypothetical protein
MTSYSVAQPLRKKDTNHKLTAARNFPILIHAMAVGDEFFDPSCGNPPRGDGYNASSRRCTCDRGDKTEFPPFTHTYTGAACREADHCHRSYERSWPSLEHPIGYTLSIASIKYGSQGLPNALHYSPQKEGCRTHLPILCVYGQTESSKIPLRN